MDPFLTYLFSWLHLLSKSSHSQLCISMPKQFSWRSVYALHRAGLKTNTSWVHCFLVFNITVRCDKYTIVAWMFRGYYGYNRVTTNMKNEKSFNNSYCEVNVFCDLQLWSSISWYFWYKDHLKVQETFYGIRCVMLILN